MLLGAVADDLTGATDLALTLSREGMRVLQVVGVPASNADFGSADAVVVSLKSRTIPAAEAVAQSTAAGTALVGAGARQLFFKYCSTFDSTDQGNIGPVTDAMLDLLGERRTMACPAFPVNKRTVYKGHLFVGDVLLSDSPMKNHPLTPMRDANLVRVLQRQTKRRVSLVDYEQVRAGAASLAQDLTAVEGIAIVDALCDEDLRIIGAAAADLRLITGGSGVALGLSDAFRKRGLLLPASPATTLSAPEGRAVIIAGSCSTATRRQIEAAKAAGIPNMQVKALDIAEGKTTVDEAVEFVERNAAGGAPLVYSGADPEKVKAVQDRIGRERAGEIVEAFMGELAGTLLQRGFSRFLVAGGETSGAVVQSLGVTALEIGPEIDPGVPWTRSSGAGPQLALALKSGNFGSDDFFLKAWRLLR